MDFIERRYAARRAEREARLRRKREVVTYTPVSEDDPARRWKGQDACPDYAMNVVLDILTERELVVQSELSEELAVRLELKLSTARAYVSGALLAFREADWVECLNPGSRKNIEWRIK